MSFIDRPRRSTSRRWLFLIHLWTGLIIGPIVGIVSLTGAIVVFRYELNRMTTPGTAYVTPQGQRLTIDALAARVQTAHPADRLWSAGWGEAGADNAWNFRAQSPEGYRIHTYINQYTGEITGRDDYHNKWMQWFYDLHVYLLAGDTGEFVNGFVGLATLILAITGLVVWWPGVSHWLFGFRYLWGAGWKRQNYDLHKVVGFYSSVAVMVVTFSGMNYTFPSLYKWGTERMTGTKAMTDTPKASTDWKDRQITIEQFLQTAERTHPGTMAVQISFPQKAGDAVLVRTKELENDWHRIGLNYVYMEPSNAQVIGNVRFSEANAATQAILFMYPLHFGRLGGHWGTFALYFVMVLYVIIGASPFVLMVTGLLMYWNRSFVKKLRRVRTRAYLPLSIPAGRATNIRP